MEKHIKYLIHFTLITKPTKIRKNLSLIRQFCIFKNRKQLKKNAENYSKI